MSDELLPCPCCSGKETAIYFKHLYHGLYGYGVWAVECRECGNIVPVASRGYDEQAFIEAWNRRTPSVLPSAEPLNTDVRATVGEIMQAVREYGNACAQIQAWKTADVIHVRTTAAYDTDAKFEAIRALVAADKGEASHTGQPSAKPVAWMREWEGDESDLGKMLFETEESELDDNPNWIPLYDHRASHSQSRTAKAETLMPASDKPSNTGIRATDTGDKS